MKLRFADDSDLTPIGQALKKFLRKHFRYVKGTTHDAAVGRMRAEWFKWQGRYESALSFAHSLELELRDIYSKQAERYAVLPQANVSVSTDLGVRRITVYPRQHAFSFPLLDKPFVPPEHMIAETLAKRYLTDLATQIYTALAEAA